ncbi:MarR family winged helix-turn-helix transcriptional regulator [Antarcticirhabdus aurantiaca]|uniref:MarR family winged helix-turn-helix transcriptional regulator n=1 Tax=Antarcticirhabdus aurantiaca TaxID=2606717 RepID=A0ACD4NRQ5_9HYPH|nr:MarR family winged helix-turn-helix transcriptional regulator [Antarcticirhabdus aurantiaca]WAJ29588.1 MarR family winged helix-turn-helix transcriptional regulator [Jeongeuplla avenae]
MSTASALPVEQEGRAQLVPLLLSISKSTRAFLALLLSEIDLHPGQDQLLMRLVPGEPISVSLLADQLSVRPSTVSKMLDRLIEKDLVQRSSNDSDARRTMVRITPDGEAVRARVRSVWERLDGELCAALENSEIGSVVRTLRQTDEVLAVKLRRLR